MLRKATNKSKQKFVIGKKSNKQGERLYLFLNKGLIDFTKKIDDAIQFNKYEEALDFVDNKIKNDNFGLEIFKMTKRKVNGGTEDRTYVNSLKRINGRNGSDSLPKLHVSQLTSQLSKEDVLNLLGDFNLESLKKLSVQEKVEKQKEIKHLCMIKIGELIDLHDSYENEYAPTNIHNKSGNRDCNCEICKMINEIAIFIESEELSKNWKVKNVDLPTWFDDYISNQKNADDFSDIDGLIYLFRDFDKWVMTNELTILDICNYSNILTKHRIEKMIKKLENDENENVRFLVRNARRKLNRTSLEEWTKELD